MLMVWESDKEWGVGGANQTTFPIDLTPLFLFTGRPLSSEWLPGPQRADERRERVRPGTPGRARGPRDLAQVERACPARSKGHHCPFQHGGAPVRGQAAPGLSGGGVLRSGLNLRRNQLLLLDEIREDG